MKKEEIKVCIMRVGGTNCDKEVKNVFNYLNINADILHANKLIKKVKSLEDYHILVFPGGFSYGDYIRAGIIWASKLNTKLGRDLKKFYEEGKLILGFCNGFQLLVELGMLPAFNGLSKQPEAALATNDSSHYECRLIFLKHENNNKCIFTKGIKKGEVLPVPIGHGEGKFMLSFNEKEKLLRLLEKNDQIVFRYCKPDGSLAEGKYPYNPNGSFSDIAGICNPEGNVLGMMPHPERNSFPWQSRLWNREGLENVKVCIQIFKNAIEYVSKGE